MEQPMQINMPQLDSYNRDKTTGHSLVFATLGQLMRINRLNSVLSNAAPETRKIILYGYLYPLVDQIEHENANEVMKMILQMDVTEVLFLLESPDELKAKVSEAMKVIRDVKMQELKDLLQMQLDWINC